MLDPNPLVNGKGVEMLRKAGKDVKVGMLEDEARRLNEVFVGSMEKKRPFVTMKAAVSLDGKIATKTCDSRWISNEESRRQANLRCINDGVLVGINTVIISTTRFLCRGSRIRKDPREDHTRLQAPDPACVRRGEDIGEIPDVGVHERGFPHRQGDETDRPGVEVIRHQR